MIEVTSQQAAVLAFLSLSTVGFICALCSRCKKKSMIVQENNQLYTSQIFHREGSRFAVTRSKTVTISNQISPNQSQSSGNVARPSDREPSSGQDVEGGYQNITKSVHNSMEPTYVDPIATPPHENNILVNDGEYANIFRTQDIEHDSSDYENTEFLQNHETDDDDEPDYVNTESTS